MKTIPLTQGQFALVDDSDYDWLSQWKWCSNKKAGGFYAIRNSPRKNGRQSQIYMHRQILDLEKGDGQQGDHRDCNTLNNQRNNLRICTSQQNTFNQKAISNTTSLFKGVCWNKKAKKWESKIGVNGKTKHLGSFHNEIFAAGVYDRAAKKYFDEFAYLNFN